MRIVFALAFLLSSAANAAEVVIVDDDLSNPAAAMKSANAIATEGRVEKSVQVFPLVVEPPSAASLQKGFVTGLIALNDRKGISHPARLAKVKIGNGSWQAVTDDGRFTLPMPASGRFKVKVSLDNDRWKFSNPNGKTYEWETAETTVSQDGVDLGTLSPDSGQENAKLGILHLTYLDALDFLVREAEISWWKSPYTVAWPGDADYYSGWSRTVTVTDALAWDVVLHELGHGIMDGAMDASMSGGSHKIDECYSPSLAWSEGWATYFAGAVRLSPDDIDARFEFLVPRRAPIRIENVPEDVCQGTGNEWRVAAGLWDLTDKHIDSESSIVPFKTFWEAARSGHTASVSDFWKLLNDKLDPGQQRLAQTAMAHNTLMAAPAAWVKSPDFPASTGARFFDGRAR